MSEFLFKGKKVYYELHGEGEPILVLNGIMMSTESWNAFKPSFSKDNLLILVDFSIRAEATGWISSTNTICRWICSKLCSNT